MDDRHLVVTAQMPIVELERVFDPFFTTKEVTKSSGMGLPMEHGIVHQHDGHVTFESEPGVGTQFRVMLPTSLEPVNDSGGRKKSEGAQTGAQVLVVDDELSIASFVGELLEFHEYRSTVLSSSIDAMRVFESAAASFDLVITDQNMSEMNGDELAKRIRGLSPNCPIILCTGYSHTISEETVGEWGNTGYLSKPIDTRKLLALVEQLVQRIPLSEKVRTRTAAFSRSTGNVESEPRGDAGRYPSPGSRDVQEDS